MSWCRAENIINTARKLKHINIPEDFEELAEKLQDHDEFKKYYKGLVLPSDGKDGEAIIFLHDNMIDELNNAEKLYVDGVFKVML